MGQVEPVNYSNAALEQRRKGTNPAKVGKKYLLYQTKSIWESCDSEAILNYGLKFLPSFTEEQRAGLRLGDLPFS